MPTARRRLIAISLAAFTIVCGLVWRLAPLHLPLVAFKYGGSALWAVMVYWLCAAAGPRLRSPALPLVATVVAAAVEFFKLVHTPALDAFRLTLAGKLLLGRFFSFTDIAVYWLAIAATACADAVWLERTEVEP